MPKHSYLETAAILSSLLFLVNGLVVRSKNDTFISARHEIPELVPRAENPTSFAWVHRLAAIGDSFTAGIGAGAHLGEVFHNHDAWTCSRYDQSYPMVVNNVIGPSIDSFQVRCLNYHIRFSIQETDCRDSKSFQHVVEIDLCKYSSKFRMSKAT